MLEARLLGELRVELNGELIPSPPSQRPWALFAYLAVSGRPVARAELASRFWPDVLDASARASLRSALWALRRQLGDTLAVGRDHIGLARDPAPLTDVGEFERLAAAGEVEQALALCGGALLEGLRLRAEQSGGRAATCAALDLGGAAPLSLWAELIRELLPDLQAPPADSAWLDDLAVLAAALPSHFGRSGRPSPAVPPELQRTRLFEAVVALLAWAAEARTASELEERLAAEIDDPELIAMARHDRGLVELEARVFGLAAQLLEAALVDGGRISRPSTRLALAEALIGAGELERAAAELRATVLEPVRPSDFPQALVPRLERVRGLLALARGDRELATRRLEESIAGWELLVTRADGGPGSGRSTSGTRQRPATRCTPRGTRTSRWGSCSTPAARSSG